MNAAERRAFFRQVFFVTWGMVTLVLLFCVGLLVYEMIQKGQNPLEFTENSPEPTLQPPESTMPITSEEILLYFADSDGRLLAPETRRIEFSDHTVENCRRALGALIQGPRDREVLRPILSEATKVRALYLLEHGELVVDFSRELVVEHKKLKSASLEALMIYGIVQTLTQSALKGSKEQQVKQVRFLVEGARPQESFPAHIDVSEPIGPDRHWVATPEVWHGAAARRFYCRLRDCMSTGAFARRNSKCG